jgi:gluconate 2-dehydrogenase gamma chain
MSRFENKELKFLVSQEEWMLSRNKFIKSLILGGVVLNSSWLTSCSESEDIFKNTAPLSKDQFITLRSLLDTLFPDDGNGPSALQVNADRYILWVLNDSLLDPAENQYIIDKLDVFAEKCKETTGSVFEKLSQEEKHIYVQSVIDDWGETWVSRLLTLIFEALLTDPMYGGNPDRTGWKWLNHDPGVPRPILVNSYPEILEK